MVFNNYNHDCDFDQFWDYEIPLLIYYAKYSGVLQNCIQRNAVLMLFCI